MKKVATIILNRNLPVVTDKLVEHINFYDKDLTDIYVIESGSDPTNLSQYATWYADWEDARKNGLRYARGMNYGLKKLIEEKKFEEYEAFFLLTNDTELEAKETINPLLEILKSNTKIGILSPCSEIWGERFLLNKKSTKFFWFIHNNAYFLRKEFIKDIYNIEEKSYEKLLFDGENFRGYGLEHELIAKAYINDWAAAITRDVIANENESHLITKADLIKTDSHNDNVKLYVDEGLKWMKKKYGFKSHWSMQQYVKMFYDMFFEMHPELLNYKI